MVLCNFHNKVASITKDIEGPMRFVIEALDCIIVMIIRITIEAAIDVTWPYIQRKPTEIDPNDASH